MNENRIEFLADHQHINLPGLKYLPPAVEKAITALQEAITARDDANTALTAFERRILDGREDLRHSPEHVALREIAEAAARMVSKRRLEAEAAANENAVEWATLASKSYTAAASKVEKLVGQLAEALVDAEAWASVGVMVVNGAGRLTTLHQAWTADPRRFALVELYAALGEHKLPAS